jgi:hypothetical protein
MCIRSIGAASSKRPNCNCRGGGGLPPRRSSIVKVLRRLSADGGRLSLRLEGLFHTDGLADAVDQRVEAAAVSELPPDALQFLLTSRYCETDLLSDFAWTNFGAIPRGWAKVQAICDFVHERLGFSYAAARPPQTAGDHHRQSHSS